MSVENFSISTIINEMFVLAFLVVVESGRLLMGHSHEPADFDRQLQKIFWILEHGVQSTIGINQTVNVSWQKKVKPTLKLCTRIRMVAMTLGFGKSMTEIGRLVMMEGLHVALVKISGVLRTSTSGVEIHGHYGRLVKFVMHAIRHRQIISIWNITKINNISIHWLSCN